MGGFFIRKFLLSSRFGFLVLAGVLLVFTIFQHKKNEEVEEQERKDSLVFNSNFQDIKRISIQTLNEQVFVAEKEKDDWMILRPIREFASAIKIEDFIDRLLNQEAQLVLSEDVSWPEYDLSPPFSVIEIQTANQKKSLGISSEPNYEGQFYIQDGKNLLIGSSDWERFSQLNFHDYSSKKLYHSSKDPVQITYKMDRVEYKFKKNKEKWEWVGKKRFPLSQQAIEDWLSLFRQDMIASFTNNEKSNNEKKNLKADLTVEFRFENQSTPWFLKFQSVSEARDQVIVSDRPYVYELKKKHGLMNVDFQEHPPSKKETKDVKGSATKSDDAPKKNSK